MGGLNSSSEVRKAAICFAASMVYDLSERTILLQSVERVGCAERWDWSWDFHWAMIAIAFTSVTTSRSPPGVSVRGVGGAFVDASVMVRVCLLLFIKLDDFVWLFMLIISWML